MPLERFEIHLPPEFEPATGAANPDCCDQFGKPWTHYIPHQGELTGSLIETTDMLLEGRGENRYGESYKPLPIPLGSVEQHLVAPIIIDFPLQYLRFVRWRTFPDNPDAPGVKINFALAYGEFELLRPRLRRPDSLRKPHPRLGAASDAREGVHGGQQVAATRRWVERNRRRRAPLASRRIGRSTGRRGGRRLSASRTARTPIP